MSKEVIIFGDGPSIRNFDLSSCSPEYDRIYCGNHIFHKDFQHIDKVSRVHYIVVEPRLFWPFYLLDKKTDYLRDVRPIELELLNRIDKKTNVQFYCHWTNFPFISRKKNTFVSNFEFPFFLRLKFMAGSFEACISLADVLGYKKVHLIGFDAFVNKYFMPNRWYEREQSFATNNESDNVRRMFSFYDHIDFNVITNSELLYADGILKKSNLELDEHTFHVDLDKILSIDDLKLFESCKFYNL